jgi:hypothetical protein
MRVAVLASIVFSGLVIAFASAYLQRSEALADKPTFPANGTRFGQGSELIALSSENSDGRQQLVVIDPKTQVMGVYQIEKNTGLISLKSIRNVQWDLKMDEFNSADPSPREIRAMLEYRK